MNPKRWTIGILTLSALAACAWVVLFRPGWLKPAPHEEEEEKVETEVAVHVAKIVRATLRKRVEAFGTVQAEPGVEGKLPASARVASPVAGVVAESFVIEGREVKKGDVLFQLDDRVARGEEEKAQAALERARLGIEFAQKAFDRQKKLMAEDATAGRKVEESEFQLTVARGELLAAEKVLSSAKTFRGLGRILAPLSGTVTRVRVNPGEAVDTNGPLAEILDLGRLVVQAQVPSGDVGLLKSGLSVEVEAEGAAPARGKVDLVGLEVDPKADVVSVRISLPVGSGLRPGRYVRVRILVEEKPGCLAVPKESVVSGREGGPATIALVEGGKAAIKPVKVGIWDGELIEVEAEGLSEGATVVTSGSYALPKQTKVRILGG